MNLLPTFPGKQVAFIDTSVTNYASLVAAVPEGVEVVLLDAAGSGLEQMAAWAASHAGYDAIHVLSHGTDGALTLGRETIDAQRLDDPAVRLLFQELGRALNPDGDLLLYGCSVAGGDVGQVFIDKLAGLTGADIAASTGLTGSAALGGDWRLEAGTGAIETMTLSAIGFDQVLGGVPPAAPTGLDLAAASDSGFSNTDNWTNIPTVVITGMAQPGTTVKLYGNDGTTVYGTTTAAGDGSWSITTIPLPTNVHRLRATATDAAGNESAASAILEVTLDTEAGPISITSDKSVLMPGETATITFGFVENPGTTFTSSDIIVAGGTLGPLSGSYPAFTAVFTPTPDASGTAQIEVPGNAFQDPAGNGNAPWSLNLPYLAAPSVSITSDKSALKVGETATITFTFSRDPGASFDSTDILVTGGTLGALSGAGATRSAVFTPTGDVNSGTASIAVPANSYTDGYGNPGKAASLSSLSFDTRAPAAPLALDLAAGSDSGFSNTDNWTNIPTVVINGTAEAGATVKLYGNDGTTVYGTTTAAGDGSWSITTIPLPTNVHRLRATATDAAGNESAASAILEVTLDTEAGPVSITSDKSVLKAGETATVTFGFIENPGATFTRSDITVTGGTLGPLSGSGTTFTAVFTPTPDATGTADIEVPTNAFQDPAGNGNSFTRVNVLAYDTMPPAAPQALDLATASDTGDSNTDNLTKLPTPLIEGTAEAGAAITLYDSDGITVIGRGSAAGDGHWAVTTDALGSGTHTITAKATDTAGNDSAASTGLAVTIDAIAPTLAITSDKASLKAGETATVTLTFSEDPGSSFDASDIAVTGGTLGTLSGSGNTRTTVFTPSANTNGGTAGITVAAGSYSDSAGNNGGAGATPALTFDTAAPSLAIASDKAALRAGETATITFTFSEDPGATFDATDIAVSGGTLGSLSGSGTTRTAVFTPDANTDAGSASITVAAGRYADAAGNLGDAGASLSLTFDTAVPAAPLALDLSAASDTGASDSDNITRNSAPLVSGTAAAGTTVTLYGSDGSTALGSATAGGDGSWSITSSALADGTHTLTARARDAAGNASAASAPLQVTVDTTGPSLAISSDKAALKAGETAAITFTFSEDPGASFTSDDIVVSGGTLGALSGNGTTRTAVFTPDATTNGGSASITVAAGLYNDAAGNSGAAASTPALVFDTSAPAAPLALDLAAASDTGSSNSDNITRTTAPVISGTAEAGATVTVYDSDGSTVLGSATAAGDGSWSVTTSALGAGTHLLTARAIDAAGNASAASASLAVTVDTTAPTLAITSDKAALKAGETAVITFTFSEDPGATFTSADIAVTGGTLGALAGSGATRTAVFTPQANTNGGSAGITVAAGSYADTAGNGGGAGLAPPLSFDTAAPSLAITSDKAALKAGETATITFTFSEDPGATFDDADITVSGGSLGALAGSGTVRTALFTPQAGTNGGAASIAVAPGLYGDSAGNSGTAGASPALAFDTAAPTLSITSDKAALKAGETAAITFTFSEDPGASFDAADVTVSGGTLGAISGTGAVRTAVFTPSANTNGGAAAISVAAGRYSDGAGNGGAAGTADALVFDTAAPTLVISSDKAALKAGETATITFTFSEDPGASFTSDDIVVSGGTLGALSGSGAMRTAVFTPDAATNGGSASITVAAGLYNDAAGNSGAPASTPALVFDTSAPAAPLALDLAAASDTGSSNSDNITRTTAPIISGTAEAGATVTVYDSDGSTVLGSATAAGDGSWSVTTSALGAGTHLLTARATDAAGNASAASASLAVTVDTTAPTLAITSDKAALKAGERATITFTFSEDPGATFTSADIAVTGGTLGALAGSGATRTAVFTPQANTNGGSAGITVAAGSYADTAGNGGGAGLAPPLSFDTAAPSLAITSDKAALKAGETATITFTFSEDTGASFTGDDIVVSGGTLGALSGNGTTRTAVFTPDAATDGGSASITVAAGLYNDAAGNSGTAAFTPALVFDTRAPAAPAAADLSAASDTGVSATDRITNNATPAFNGTAGPGTLVTLYGDDGKTALGTGTTAADGRWTIISAPLSAGKHALSVTATDAAGNVSLASDAMHVEIDTVAPSLLTAAVDGNTVTLTFDQEVFAPSAAGLLLTAGTSSYVASSISGSGTKVLSLALTSAVESGTQVMLAYDPAAASSELKDVAGNEVAGFAGRVLLNWTAPPVVTQQTEVTVDGVNVRQQLTVSDDGTTSQVMVIPVVAPGRVDAVGDNTVADIPLVKDAGGSSLLLAQVPVGMGVEVSGFAKPQPAGQSLTDLLRAIEARTGPGSSDQGAMTAGGTQFLSDLPKNNPLLVQTIIPTAAATGSTSTAPLVISAAPQAPGTAATALVVDASKLAPGAAIELPHVQFAAIVGAATITGGPGSHIIWGDSASQNMMLGSGDDIVHGGAGNDIVGGGAGNDRIFGDDGNDVVSGGEGNDFIDGGNGTDILQLSGAGRSDYQMRVENGLLVLTQRNGGIDGTDRVAGVETLRFMGANGGPGELDFTKSDVATLVRLYDSLFGRRPDEAGLNYWIERSESGMSMQAIAAGFIDSIEAGKQPPMGNQPFVQWLYQTGLHRSGAAAEIDYWSQALDAGMSRTDLVLAFADSAEHVKLVGVIGTSIDVL